MKVFVGYGYNPRDEWVERLVLPLLRACGAEPVTGEETYGGPIPPAVRRAIDQCDAIIGFTTRRDPGPNGVWTTHRWVTDELAYAGRRIPVLEVREEGVDPQSGSQADLQYILYQEAKRDELLVKVARVVARWRDQMNSVLVQLKPQEFVDGLGRLVNDSRTRCTLAVMDEDTLQPEEQPAQILPIKGGLFIRPTRLPRGALIQVKVEAGGRYWYSSYESVDTLSVFLNEG